MQNDIQSLLEAYNVTAARPGQATDDSDPKTGNEQAEVIAGVYQICKALDG